MGKVAIVTDSNSGITQDLARDLGVSVIPMPFYINEKLYLEGITLSQEEFYERLKNEESISTSQPGPADVCGLWNTLLESYDQIVHIPMSSGLSASCDTASGLAREYDGKVQVVDNQRISVTQKQSVLDALSLRSCTQESSLKHTHPPSMVLNTFVAWKENIEASPKDADDLPLYFTAKA